MLGTATTVRIPVQIGLVGASPQVGEIQRPNRIPGRDWIAIYIESQLGFAHQC